MTNQDYIYYMKRMLGHVKRRWPVYAVGMFIYTAQMFVLDFLTADLLRGIVAGVLESDSQYLWDTVIAFLWRAGAFMLILAIGVYATMVAVGYITRDLSLQVFGVYINQSLEDSQSTHSGEGISALRNDLTQAVAVYSDHSDGIMMGVWSIVFSLITLLVIDWRIGLGALAIGLLGYGVQTKLGKPLAKLGEELLQEKEQATKSLTNLLAGAVPIRVFQMQARTLSTFDTPIGQIRIINVKQGVITMWQNLFTTLQGWLSLVLTFGLGGFLVSQGELELPVLLMVPTFTELLARSMSQLGTSLAQIKPSLVAAKRIIDRLDSHTPHAKEAHPSINPSGYCLNLQGVNFAYESQAQPENELALTNIDLTIPENTLVAFVGESGSGKSTLLRLIVGMYQRDNLAMSIGLADSSQGVTGHFTRMNPRNWREQFAYVDQSYKLFDMSIADNIALGKAGQSVTQADIESAAKKAGAHDFITALPEGYDTTCGESGQSLSGGQKQRIAIARAILRDAKILVFDEATSALDPESQAAVMETIVALKGSHTILMTTHNMEQLDYADQVVTLDGGRLVG